MTPTTLWTPGIHRPDLATLPAWAWPAATAGAVALLLAAGYALGRRRNRRTTEPTTASTGGVGQSRWVETGLTLAAAGIATAVAVSGMWRVFGDVLGFTGPGRIALAGFLEIALMVSAIRARRALRETGSVGVDGAAVWAMALLSAVLATADADGLAKAVRFAAPLVAAWLWERGMAAERRAATGPRARIAWRWTRAHLAVRLGLADPAARAVDDIDRARRLARLTKARIRLAVLETSQLPRLLAILTGQPLRIAYATWRLQRHALAAVEHLHLGLDPTITGTIRTTVAAVTGLRDATAPAALAASSPWAHPALPHAGHADTGHGDVGHSDPRHGSTGHSEHVRGEHGHTMPGTPGGNGARARLNGHEHASTGTEHPLPVPVGNGRPGRAVAVRSTSTPVMGVPVTSTPDPLWTADPARHGASGNGSASGDGTTTAEPPADDHEIAAAIAAIGSLPSVRAIKTAYRVGNARAARLRTLAQEHLNALPPASGVTSPAPIPQPEPPPPTATETVTETAT